MQHYIEAVSVCHNYSDFLEVVIPYNLPMFDRWLIVTHPSDTGTREVCRKFGLECLLTEEGNEAGEFAKGRMVERGLQHLSASGWRLHIDSDIVLPRHFRKLLEVARLQTSHVYGADRIMVRGWDQWQKLLATRWLEGGQHGYSHGVTFPPGFELGTRWAGVLTGYVPIGFFQLWHSDTDEWRGVRIKPYPDKHGTACRTDVQHALQWDRKNRELIPELVVAHLESEAAKKGVNWNGRRTIRFGAPGSGSPPVDSSKAGS